MKIVNNLQQGSADWLQFRATRFGSSEAAAMLGLSEHCTRTELLRIKHTGLEREFGDWFRRNVLDKGHAVEAATRPMIEAQIGEDLYPVTCQGEGRLVASCDGLDLDCRLAWECKQWNEALAANVQAGNVPDTHMPQCQHILLVTGAERLRFTVSDGTGERLVSTEVLPSPEWFQRLRDGWAQFEKDLAAYVPPPLAEPVTAEPMETLPAVSVRMDGALIVHSNLQAFGAALRDFIDRIPAKPATDQEFATAKAACKALKLAEDALDKAEAGALASIVDVSEMQRLKAELHALARSTRLAREKDVERRERQIKEDAVAAARAALDAHIATLNAELAPMRLQPVAADFAGAIKGRRSIASMQDALDTTLAGAKIAADGQARLVRGNVSLFKDDAHGLEFLFHDLGQIVHKAADDFATLVHSRVDAHQAAEAEKARKADEAEAQRIAAAEQRAREQEAARIAEQQRQEEVAAARKAAEARAEAAAAVGVIASPGQYPPPAGPVLSDKATADASAVAFVQRVESAADEPATLKLGVICERLGFTVSAAFLADALHVRPAKSDGAARLYREAQFQAICSQLQSHVGAMAELYSGEVV